MEKAVELFGEDDEHQRSYALNLIGMATVHLLQREPEQSTVLAGQALKIARKVRSERVNTRLRKTVDTAARDFGDVADVARLTDLLSEQLPETAETV
ncbi:NsdA OS=Streptomyces microflavus OX=1919 GN=G3I39_30845 PE=4 SV=1 [Streptomyces microflavus]